MKKLLLLILAIVTLTSLTAKTPQITDSTFWENNINNRKWVITHIENKSLKEFSPDGKWFYFFDSFVISGEDSRIFKVASNHPTVSGNNAFIVKYQ